MKNSIRKLPEKVCTKTILSCHCEPIQIIFILISITCSIKFWVGKNAHTHLYMYNNDIIIQFIEKIMPPIVDMEKKGPRKRLAPKCVWWHNVRYTVCSTQILDRVLWNLFQMYDLYKENDKNVLKFTPFLVTMQRVGRQNLSTMRKKWEKMNFQSKLPDPAWRRCISAIVTQWCLFDQSIKLILCNETPSERTKLIENCGFGKISSSVQYVKRYRFCSHYEKQNLLSTEFDYNLKTYWKPIYLLGCKRSMIALIFYFRSIKLWSTV